MVRNLQTLVSSVTDLVSGEFNHMKHHVLPLIEFLSNAMDLCLSTFEADEPAVSTGADAPAVCESDICKPFAV